MGGGIYWGAGEAVNGGTVLEGRDRLYNRTIMMVIQSISYPPIHDIM